MKRILFVLAALLICETTFAITWCHDYTMFMVTGKDADETGPDQLRTAMNKDYECGFTISPSETTWVMQANDEIIIGNAHSGVVNSNQRMNHYLQPSGKATTKLLPQEILSKPRPNFFHD